MKAKKILLNSLPLVLVGGAMAFAAAPIGGYLPNATLDPDCAPGDMDCFVQVAIDEDPWFGVDDNAIATENTESIYTLGNVGIGEISPSTLLHLTSASPRITLKDDDSTSGVDGHSSVLQFVDQNDDVTGKIGFGTSRQIMFFQNGNAGGSIRFSTSSTSGTAGAADVTITNSGSLAVGTINSDSKLTVVGLPSGTDDSVTLGDLSGAVCITDVGNTYINTNGSCN